MVEVGRWERKASEAEIPLSFQFSILLGRFACVIPQHISCTSGGSGGILEGGTGAGDGRRDAMKDVRVMGGAVDGGEDIKEWREREGKCIYSLSSRLAL